MLCYPLFCFIISINLDRLIILLLQLIIIKNILTLFFYYSPVDKHDFQNLARDIVELFPSETTSLYYVPPISKKNSRNQKSVPVRGKLVDKYRNKVRQSKRIFSDNTTSSTDQENELCKLMSVNI